MNVLINPYIGFKGNAREAMEFYKSVFDGNLEMNTFKEFHASEDPAEANKIMHAMLTTDNGITLMGSDTPQGMEYQSGKRVSISLSGDNEKLLRGYWDKLVAGGTVRMPIEKAPWGDIFGMLTDKYDVDWLININAHKA